MKKRSPKESLSSKRQKWFRGIVVTILEENPEGSYRLEKLVEMIEERIKPRISVEGSTEEWWHNFDLLFKYTAAQMWLTRMVRRKEINSHRLSDHKITFYESRK